MPRLIQIRSWRQLERMPRQSAIEYLREWGMDPLPQKLHEFWELELGLLECKQFFRLNKQLKEILCVVDQKFDKILARLQ